MQFFSVIFCFTFYVFFSVISSCALTTNVLHERKTLLIQTGKSRDRNAVRINQVVKFRQRPTLLVTVIISVRNNGVPCFDFCSYPTTIRRELLVDDLTVQQKTLVLKWMPSPSTFIWREKSDMPSPVCQNTLNTTTWLIAASMPGEMYDAISVINAELYLSHPAPATFHCQRRGYRFNSGERFTHTSSVWWFGRFAIARSAL